MATLRVIEDVLRKAKVPLSRYQIRKQMGNRIAQPLLDEALDYLADHGMVNDEGPGGRAVWIQVTAETLARLKRR